MGIAHYARTLGAQVLVCDLNPVRQLAAMQEGCDIVTLAEGLRESDMVVTATGREGMIGAKEFLQLLDRCVLANVGHSNLEIDVPALRRYPSAHLGPALEEVNLGDRRIYLLAEGAMLNLAAGPGDPYDAFDFTSAVMLAGVEFMVRHHADYPPGIHLLPEEVEQRIGTRCDPVLRVDNERPFSGAGDGLAPQTHGLLRYRVDAAVRW